MAGILSPTAQDVLTPLSPLQPPPQWQCLQAQCWFCRARPRVGCVTPLAPTAPALAAPTTSPQASAPREPRCRPGWGQSWGDASCPGCATPPAPGFLETAQSRATTKLLSWLLRSDMKPQVPAGCSAEAWAGSPACAGGELRQRGERCGKHSTHPRGHFPGAAERPRSRCAPQHQGCPRRGVPQPRGACAALPMSAVTLGRGSSTQKRSPRHPLRSLRHPASPLTPLVKSVL